MLMELVAWAFLERSIFSGWFPGLPETVETHMKKMEPWIRHGGWLTLFPIRKI